MVQLDNELFLGVDKGVWKGGEETLFKSPLSCSIISKTNSYNCRYPYTIPYIKCAKGTHFGNLYQLSEDPEAIFGNKIIKVKEFKAYFYF